MNSVIKQKTDKTSIDQTFNIEGASVTDPKIISEEFYICLRMLFPPMQVKYHYLNTNIHII